MFWIKDIHGNLVNLMTSHFIKLRTNESNSGSEVAACFGQHAEAGFSIVVFAGTTAECGRYRDDLFARLKEFQEANRV